MANCRTFPTGTLFGPSDSVSTLVSTFTSFSLSTEPASTIPEQVVTTRCSSLPALLSAIVDHSSCSPQTITSFSVIPGRVVTVPVPIETTLFATVVLTVPTQTLFGTSCDSTSATGSTPSSPINTLVSSTALTSTPPPTFPASSTPSSTSATSPPNLGVSFSLSTPPPSIWLVPTSITSDGSVLSSDILMSSNFPATTIFAWPSSGNRRQETDNVRLIGGVVGSVVAFSIAIGIMICLWRRKRKRPDDMNTEYEKDTIGRFGRRLELDLDDDDVVHPPYQYGLMVGPNGHQDSSDRAYSDEPSTMHRSPMTSPSPPSPQQTSSFVSFPFLSSPYLSDNERVNLQSQHLPSPSDSPSLTHSLTTYLEPNSPPDNSLHLRRHSSRSSLSTSLLPPLKVTNASDDDHDNT